MPAVGRRSILVIGSNAEENIQKIKAVQWKRIVMIVWNEDGTHWARRTLL